MFVDASGKSHKLVVSVPMHSCDMGLFYCSKTQSKRVVAQLCTGN